MTKHFSSTLKSIPATRFSGKKPLESSLRPVQVRPCSACISGKEVIRKKELLNKTKVFAAVLAAIVCAAIIGIPGCSPVNSSADRSSLAATVVQAQEPSPASGTAASRDTVTVSAKGSTRAVPDRAELRFGIRTQADTAEEAQKANTRNVDAVVKVLKKNGIKEENIQTTMYDVSPQYDWNTGDGSNVIGYSAFSNLTVKDAAIEEAGKLITACTKAGANEFNGISYTSTQYDTLYAEALKKAVAAAQSKAGVLADAAGRKLGPVAMIVEGYQDMTYANTSEKVFAAGGMGAAEDSASAANILPGQAEITANVTVTYTLE